ncbi:MAG: xanthine dehydrogenase family protein molybdopterin-binding subunit [Alphaproteobacteria bacterium]|jgi:aerobic carbon-monoxide dehydrogenase large subunit|nr:xanthine dehydrogenase family protein molybdopterin-binding subunit [Alphaproteobacteria bacterium]
MVKYGVGQPVRRTEDPRLLTGRGKFNDDISRDGEAIGFVLRSPHAHADIRSIDSTRAAGMPGVLAVLTGRDLADDGIGTFPGPPPFFASLTKPDGSPLIYPPQYALTSDRVRYVGDPVAFVIAETLDQARDASEAIEVDYAMLDSVVDTAAAMNDDEIQLWDDVPKNFLFQAQIGDSEATAKAFENAAHISTVRLVNQRIVQNSMEVRGAIGSYDAESGRYTIYTSNQNRHMLRDWIANSFLKCDPSMVRVLVDDVGGGFGMKTHPYPEQVLVLVAAKRLGRTVRWISDRTEAFLSDLHGRDHISDCELALDQDGKFLAVRVKTVANIGAYSCSAGVSVPTQIGPKILTSVYDIPLADVEVKCVVTNTAPVGPYRGAGRPEAVYVMERLVDVAAHDLGIDPVEMRRRNLIAKDQFPYTNAVGTTYDSGAFEDNMDMAAKMADWTGHEKRREEARKRGRLSGIAVSQYLETTAGNPTESAEVEVTDDQVIVKVGTQPMGQGHDTSFMQLISEKLGLDFEQVHIDTSDSDNLPSGGGSHGSRTSHVGSVAAINSSDEMVRKGTLIASEMLETAAVDVEYADGEFRVAGTDRAVTLFDVANHARTSTSIPEELRGPLTGTDTHTIESWSYPNGCHVCELEIEEDTGVIHIVRYCAMDDVGRVINPMLVAGQVHGGVAQGIGQAIMENTVYDNETGQMISSSFMDYTMPRADDMPMIELDTNEVPCLTNVLGVKGAGEAGALVAPPVLIAAITDALRDFDVAHIDMPATPERIWQLMQNRKAA